MKTARYWQREGEKLRCLLCPHHCVLAAGKTGLCGVRQHQDGTLVSLNYAQSIAAHSDPIEKKPLFHVLPGSTSLSVATVGCNMRCDHCQNHDISQYPRQRGSVAGTPLPPEQVVAAALQAGADTISFTYSEPTIFMEWAQDIAVLAREASLRCVSVTNGYTAAQPIVDLAPNLLAANVDLKSYSEDFYQKICGAQLGPVLDTIRLLHQLGVWVEVTTLLIPGLNDEPEQLNGIAAFLASVDPAIPWHLSRFHPDHNMVDRPPTPVSTISTAREIGAQHGLRFVYTGNVWGDEGENTRCPACGDTVIERHGFSVRHNYLDHGCCPACGQSLEGRWR